MNVAHLLDHSLLEPTATLNSIEQLCEEAMVHQFRAVCIPPLFVKKAKAILSDSNVRIATVTGFPFGYSAIEAKLAETVLAIVDGADEIDMMINLAALKNGDWQWLAKEINTILPIIRSKGRLVKVILETGLLDDKELITCCDIYGAAGVDMIKTSSGFAAKHASAGDVKLLRKHLADAVKINAGPVSSYESAQEMLNEGASMVSSFNSIQIVKEAGLLK